jgi:hypothetical protein
MTPEALRTLEGVAEALKGTHHDWWLFGGAAVALHGLDIEIADVDVVMAESDLRRVIDRLGIAANDQGSVDRIRSDVWARWTALPLGVDLTAGLQVRAAGGWIRIAPKTRETVMVEGLALYVPARRELIEILRLFGRSKDLERVEGLSRLRDV